MFGRRRSDGGECRFGGDHAVSMPRLRVVVARMAEYLQSPWLMRDAAAQHWMGWKPAQELPRHATLTHDPLMLALDMIHFVGTDRLNGRLVASISLVRRPD